ncbi:hypothetical protein BDP55DRAFT_750104 [Colletotrichum godetiae]|uniref:Uncharacterized protein n=1 Tax=Colletotrichum godetiae TaxID=1209918 RepID=A0AAJ0EV05_9PEZI|nr:uncharacterized protein BDP55DRAFT_750104 [Colletotrichum godetiae]KAK1672744.1 hypothetical protein BDP55DRAFT_750104 [Colletotrichum godetiae]
MRTLLFSIALAAALARNSLAQFPPAPEGVTVLKSKIDDGIEISYKKARKNRLHKRERKADLTSSPVFVRKLKV